MYVREMGPADAPTLVLLHGGGVSGWIWQPIWQRLPQFHYLVPDLPEHGKSAAAGPFTIRDAAERIAELIATRAHGGRAHVVGLSLGGQVTTQLLATAPQCLQRVVLSGTAVRPAQALAFARHPWGRRLLQGLITAYMPFRNLDWLLRANQRALGIPDDLTDEFRADTRRLTVDAFLRIVVDQSQAFRIPAGSTRANVPVLVMAGQKEDASIMESLRELVSTLPQAHGAIAPGLGHHWCLEAPGLFARTVQAWLSDQPLPLELRSPDPAG